MTNQHKLMGGIVTVIFVVAGLMILGVLLSTIINGPNASVCIGGYEHNPITGAQIFNSQGTGIPCR